MKKFPITKFYFNLFVALFVIFLFLTIFYTKVIINIFSEDGPFFSGYIIYWGSCFRHNLDAQGIGFYVLRWKNFC